MNGNEMMEHVTADGRGGCELLFRYRDVYCSQSRNVFTALDALYEATKDRPAETIVEVGTFHGGFTRILRDHNVSMWAKMHSFDIKDTLDTPVPNVEMHIGDCFADNGAAVSSLTTAPGRCYVFCDGGAKEKEVNFFSGHLKPGDLILCHDYVKDASNITDEEAARWKNYESQFKNVKDALEKNGCEPFMEAEMARGIWGCWLKR